MGAGHTSISYETPDLMFDARLQLQAEEYNTVRIKLSELTKQAITESLAGNEVIYDINQYYKNSEEFKTGCEKGREYYPKDFPDNQDCIVTRKKSKRDTRRCSLIGPIAVTKATRAEQTHGVLGSVGSASSSASNLLGSESENNLTPLVPYSPPVRHLRRRPPPVGLELDNHELQYNNVAYSSSAVLKLLNNVLEQRRQIKHEGGGNIPLEEFVAPDNITEEDIYDINKLIAPYKDVSTVEELIDLADKRLKEQAPGLRRRKGKLENNLLQLENAKHNLAVLKQKPTKLHQEGGYRKKTMYKRTKFIRKTRRKLRNN
jgi:hypothetical protein